MAVYPVSRSFQCRHLHVTAVISFPTWKSSLLLVCFLPCVILRGKVCLTNLGASYLTAATTWRKQILARNFVATSIDPLELRTKLPSFICFFFFRIFLIFSYFFKCRTCNTFHIANIRISIFRISSMKSLLCIFYTYLYFNFWNFFFFFGLQCRW